MQPIGDGLSLIAYRNVLDSARAKLQETWDARARTLKGKEGGLFQLYADIGAGIEAGFSNIGDRMSIARIASYDAELARVTAIKAERAAAIAGLAAEINGLWEELGFVAADDAEKSISRGEFDSLGWSTHVIARLRGKIDALLAEKAAREERIMVMGQAITALWKRLATPEEEQTAFLEAHAGIGDDVIAAVSGEPCRSGCFHQGTQLTHLPLAPSKSPQCEKYLAIKQSEFAVRLVELIATARATIESLWKEMRLTSSERASAFPPFFAAEGTFADDLFLAHEAYIARATATLEDMRPILRGIEKRESLLADKVEYEGIIADPHRLVKGSSSARLLEEKLERRVKKELPAFNKRLHQMISEFEMARGGASFTIDGVRFLDVLDEQEAVEAKAAKDARALREARQRGEEPAVTSAVVTAAAAAAAAEKSRATSNPRTSSATNAAKHVAAKIPKKHDGENGAIDGADSGGHKAIVAPLGVASGVTNKAPTKTLGKATGKSAAIAPPPAPQPFTACSLEAAESAVRILQNL